LSFKKA